MVASDAEIDLVVNATRALRDLERDLDRLVNQAEASADPVLIAATLDRTLALRSLRADLDEMVRAAQAATPDVHVRVDVDDDEARRRLGDTPPRLLRVADAATRALGPVAGLAGGLAKAGAAAGTAVPLLAGVVASVESIIPAAAVAVPAILTVGLAAATVKIAMTGVGDAISTAFDPEAKPEDLAKAMKNLAPEARRFVKELSGLKKEFREIRLDVQNRLFTNFDGIVERLGDKVLPRLGTATGIVADSLNEMAHQAATAAADFGESSAFGTALNGSIIGLRNLESVPAQVVTAFGQLAAAAAPAFARITSAVGRAATEISAKLTTAFESGALTEAIDTAIDVIKQLGRIVGNVFAGIGNIIGGVTSNGEGLFFILEKITQGFEDLTASKEFQGALLALVKVMSQLASTVLPLLGEALKAIFPVIEILGPPLQELIKNLGTGLQPVITALGPVLAALAVAFVKLIPALQPIIDLALQLIADILPILTPLFEHLGEVFERFTPIVATLAANLAAQLRPVLQELPGILEQILPLFLKLADELIPLLLDSMTELTPSLTELGLSFAELLVEITPLIVKLIEIAAVIVTKLLPILVPLAALITGIVAGAFRVLAKLIREFMIPAVQAIVALLNGDFRGAMTHATEFVNNLKANASKAFSDLRSNAVRIVTDMAASVVARARQLASDVVRWVSSLVTNSVSRLRALPGQAVAALGNLGSLLFSAGSDLVQGFINGMTSRIGGIISAARRIADAVPGTVKGLLGINSPSRVLADVGDDVMAGLQLGLARSMPDLRAQVEGIALSIPRTIISTGQSVGGSDFTAARPVLNIQIGDRFIDRYVDRRIDSIDQSSARVFSQGVRR